MEPLELIQEKTSAECVGVHHQIKKDGYHARYLSQEPGRTLQVSGGSTQSFAKVSDALQAHDTC
jgi:hypothetical protein